MERIYPDLQSTLLCEDVRNEASGQQTIVGIISSIMAPQVPIGFLKLCLWTRWTGGSGTFHQRSLILNAEDERPLVVAELDFHLAHMESHATNVNVFGGVHFPTYGTYHAEIHLDDELKMRFSFPVIPIPQRGPAHHPPMPPGI